MPTVYSTRNQGWIPSLFNDFFDDNWMPTIKYQGTTPAINVSEDEKEYKVEVAAPGMSAASSATASLSRGSHCPRT